MTEVQNELRTEINFKLSLKCESEKAELRMNKWAEVPDGLLCHMKEPIVMSSSYLRKGMP